MDITTPLGKDFLLVNRFQANEALSTLFSIDVELLHEENNPGYKPTLVSADSLLGKSVTVDFHHRDDTTRSFSRHRQPLFAGRPRCSLYLLLRDHRAARLDFDAENAEPHFSAHHRSRYSEKSF